MARLPQPGSDDGTWGDVLNDFLSQTHNPDGTLKDTGVVAAKADDSTVIHNSGNETAGGIKTFSASPIVPTPTIGTQAANKAYVDATAIAGAPDATTISKGVVQLTGDLTGTATSPQIAAGVIVDADVNTSAAIAQGKVANLTTDLAAKASTTDLNNHTSNTATHGATGAVVGTTNSQTLTNKTLTSPVINTPTGITKSDVGLGDVDNTTDASKPISTSTQTALDTKASISDLNTHVNDSAAAHAASAISFTPTGTIAATDVQAAIAEVASEAGGGSPLTVQDEGTPLATAATTLDFVGAGVTASGTGAIKTITIPGGGSSPDADASTKGLVQLAGDLSGTAASPTVPALNRDTWKAPVRTMEPAGVNISAPGASLGGVTLIAGDRVLLIGTGNQAERGIWVFNGAASPLTRPADSVTGTLSDGATIWVTEGNYQNYFCVLTTNNPIVVGTTAQTWTVYDFGSFATIYQAQRTLSVTNFINPGVAAVAANVLPPGLAIGFDTEIALITIRAGTAPAGSDLIVDINLNGTPMHTITLFDGTTVWQDSVSQFISAGTIITYDISQVGSVTPGSDIAIDLVGT